jgi:hypothetical protein
VPSTQRHLFLKFFVSTCAPMVRIQQASHWESKSHPPKQPTRSTNPPVPLKLRNPFKMPYKTPSVKKVIHPKLRNFNLHNVTHSLISRNPREWMFIIQISLLIVTYLSLISQILSLMQITKEVNPHPCIAPYVNMWSVTFLLFFVFFR